MTSFDGCNFQHMQAELEFARKTIPHKTTANVFNKVKNAFAFQPAMALA